MREIKFKAWDKVKEEWIYSDKFPSMWQYFKELENRGIRHYESYQYTGLRDKNGKEIYEGNIVKYFKTEYQVAFIEGSFELVGTDKYGKIFKTNRIITDACIGEVIGNIYENPEYETA